MNGDELPRDRPAPVLPASETAPAPDLDAVSDAVTEDAPVAPEAPAAPASRPRTEAPSADVAAVPLASRMPGAARDGYHSLPTAPVITATSGPVEGESVPWQQDAIAPQRRSQIAPWALGLAVLALVLSFFVGWMLPLGAVAVTAAIIALRRYESRPLAIWALVLGAVAVLYSAGWLIWALPQLPA